MGTEAATAIEKESAMQLLQKVRANNFLTLARKIQWKCHYLSQDQGQDPDQGRQQWTVRNNRNRLPEVDRKCAYNVYGMESSLTAHLLLPAPISLKALRSGIPIWSSFTPHPSWPIISLANYICTLLCCSKLCRGTGAPKQVALSKVAKPNQNQSRPNQTTDQPPDHQHEIVTRIAFGYRALANIKYTPCGTAKSKTSTSSSTQCS